MPSRRTNNTRAQKPRKIAEGTYLIGNQLIIDASKVDNSPLPTEEDLPKEADNHPEADGHAPHETGRKEGGVVIE